MCVDNENQQSISWDSHTHHDSGLTGVHAELVPLHRARAVIVGTPELEAQVVMHLLFEKGFSPPMNKDEETGQPNRIFLHLP